MAVCRRQALGWLVDRAVWEGLARGGGRIPHPQEVGGGGGGGSSKGKTPSLPKALDGKYIPEKNGGTRNNEKGWHHDRGQGSTPLQRTGFGIPEQPCVWSGWDGVVISTRGTPEPAAWTQAQKVLRTVHWAKKKLPMAPPQKITTEYACMCVCVSIGPGLRVPRCHVCRHAYK